MKIRLLIVLSLLAAGFAGWLWWQGSPSTPARASAPVAQQPAADQAPAAPSATVAATPPPPPPAHSPSTPARPDLLPPEGERFLASLPSGPLRTSLLALAPEIRARALARLVKLNPPKEDYPNLHVSPDGYIFVVCEFKPPTDPASSGKKSTSANPAPSLAAAGPVIAASGPVVAASPVPITSPPLRHSRPGATNVLFLDFGGMTITGTSWNTSYTVASWIAKPYDLDSNPTTFNDTEQANIIQIWERVAEDYSPFDVDVTTERPASFTRTTGHALITSQLDANSTYLPGNSGSGSVGGLAYVGVFGDATYPTLTSPALVYFDNLGSADNIAEAASHELGHNMGLSHQGTSVGGQAYYGGHGTGDISWGPIMGTGYGQNVSQWCKGEYYDANNTEDAMSIIAGRLAYRPASAGSTLPTTALAGVAGTTLTTSGVLRNNGDLNVYAFTTGAGTVTLNANPYKAASGTFGGNTDLKLELLDSGGNVVASNDPPDHTYSSVTYGATAGTYFVRLTPMGTGTPLSATPTGYTSYGSAGQYALTGTLVAAAPAIVGSLSASTPAAQLFSYQILGTDSPTSYAATGLPSGLNVNPSTGLISGRPLAVGSFPVSLSAINAQGTGNATLTLTVTNAAPVITAQTSSFQSITRSDPLSLSATVLSPSGTATYQWYHNGLAVGGASTTTLNLVNTTFTDAGWYQLQATNGFGTSSSAPVFVLIGAPTAVVAGWGDNTHGTTTIPGGLTHAVQIVAGSAHAAALLADGTVVAWGDNTYQQTVVPAGLSNVVAIAAGSNHTLALKSDGTVVSWGDNGWGQGNIPAGLTGVVAIAGGTYQSFILKADGTVQAWGNNFQGVTTVPGGLSGVVSIACGPVTCIAVKGDGTVAAWGSNWNGETDPTNIGLVTNALTASGGTYNTVVVKANGTVGVVGYSGSISPLNSATGVRLLSAGVNHALALKTDGTVAAGGIPASGSTTVPAAFTGAGASAFGIVAANDFSLALRDATTYIAPGISSQPTNQTAAPGGTATFTLTATGTPAPSYQWRKAGTPIPGATANTLTLTNVSAADAASYDCFIANGGGTVTSNAVTLKLTQTISFGSIATQAYPSSPLTLSATATSGLPVTFSVFSGPASVSGTNGTTLTLSGAGTVVVQADQAGNSTYVAAPAVQQSFTVNATGFATWQAANYNLPGEATQAAPGYIYAQDGLTNLVKYVLGLSGKANATTGLPVLTTNGTSWLYTYNSPSTVTDVTVTVEVSTDLVAWTSAGVTLTKTGTSGGIDTWQASYPVASAPNAFFRIKAVQ